jgi:hypothetical protein
VSELFQLEVRARQGDRIDVRCEVVHPDQHEIPVTHSFALFVIVDVFDSIRRGFFLDCPRSFDRAEAARVVAAHPRRDDLERFKGLVYGPEELVSEAEYDALERDVRSGRGLPKGVHGLHFGVDGRFKVGPPDFAGFVAEAARVVTHVELIDASDNPRTRFWFKDGENGPDPRGTLAITVADPSMVAHMMPGFAMASAAYDVAPRAVSDRGRLH